MASNIYATVPGGLFNVAGGQYSFAAGQHAKAVHDGSFVWADSTTAADFASTASNQFLVRASGGVGIGTTSPLLPLQVSQPGPYGHPALGALDGTTAWSYLLADNSFHNSLIWDAARDMRFGTEASVGSTLGPTYNELVRIKANGSVGIGTSSPTDGILDIEGDTHINDHDIFLRAGNDRNHGLGYRDAVAGIHIDGPFLYGYSGGALGGSGPVTASLVWDWQGNVWVSNNLSTATLTIRGGSDLAEPFQMSSDDVPKGAVVVIDEDHPGKLKLSESPYDNRVAGIVSGANGVNPGITLHQEGVLEDGQHVALSGRVYAQADASNGPIKPGDLLTTSDTAGHVMKVTDHAKAQGAIVGKAMTPLKDGRGMVLVLVSLQ